MVRDFHRVIGVEAREQILAREGRLPDELIACVGRRQQRDRALLRVPRTTRASAMTGVEAGGRGIRRGDHAARFAGGKLGVLQGCKTFILQDPDGQIELTHSVSAGPRLCGGRARARLLPRPRPDRRTPTRPTTRCWRRSSSARGIEGIIPALESTHALVARPEARPGARRRARSIIINLSGRGDKDVQQVAKLLGEKP